MPENAVNTPNMPIVEDVDIVDRISTEFERSFRPNSVDIVESYF